MGCFDYLNLKHFGLPFDVAQGGEPLEPPFDVAQGGEPVEPFRFSNFVLLI